MRNPDLAHFYPIPLLVIGAILLLVGLLLYLRANYLKRSWLTTTGTILSLRKLNNLNGLITYAPVFSFVASDGKRFVIASNTGNSPSKFPVGNAVSVLYNPADPSKAVINEFWQLWTYPVVLSILGAVILGAGLIWRFFKRPHPRSRHSLHHLTHITRHAKDC